jgi:hypothetical protein
MLSFNQFISEARLKFNAQSRIPGGKRGRTVTRHSYGRDKARTGRSGRVESDFYISNTGKKMLHLHSYPEQMDFPKNASLTPHLSSAARAMKRAGQVHGVKMDDPDLVVTLGMDVRDPSGTLSGRLQKQLPRVFKRFKLPVPHSTESHANDDFGLY